MKPLLMFFVLSLASASAGFAEENARRPEFLRFKTQSHRIKVAGSVLLVLAGAATLSAILGGVLLTNSNDNYSNAGFLMLAISPAFAGVEAATGLSLFAVGSSSERSADQLLLSIRF